MKKLMLSAFVAVLALASCNKEDATPVNNRLRSVEVSIGNKIITKGLAGDKIKDKNAVQVNNIKIYLTDANETTVYDAFNADGKTAAKTYFTSAELADGATATFHYVDPKCTRVIAVANVGDINLAAAKSTTLAIENQQDQKTLALYAFDDLEASGSQHVTPPHDAINGVEKVTDVYIADLNLTPRISRFEVDGFNVIFNSTTPKYQKIEIKQLAFQNYFPTTDLATGTESGTVVRPIADFTKQAAVYTWLNNSGTGWFRDAITLDEITPAASKQNLTNPLAYHMFSCGTVPEMVIQLEADGQPAYIYTDKFIGEDNNAITEILEGHIYRMSAEGEVDGTDGNIPIPEEKIDPMDRCLEIKVSVHKWIVDLVTPEF